MRCIRGPVTLLEAARAWFAARRACIAEPTLERIHALGMAEMALVEAVSAESDEAAP